MMTLKEIIERLQEISCEINNGLCFAGRNISSFDDYREDFDEAYTNLDDLTQTLLTKKNMEKNNQKIKPRPFRFPTNYADIIKHYPFLQDLYDRIEELETEVDDLRETLAHANNDIVALNEHTNFE